MKKLRLALTVALGLFIVATSGVLVLRTASSVLESPSAQNTSVAQPTTRPEEPATTSPATASSEAAYVVYYFHGDVRCTSCRRIEAWAFEAVRNGFGDDIRSGRLSLQRINVDQSGNRHYIRDYQLHTRTVVLTEQRSGHTVRYRSLDRVWNLLQNREAFHQYVQSALGEFMEG
jgi:hypothetical protein